eukprot:gene55578-76160_t
MRPLPGFLCIGTQKSATSWFFNVLQEHPKVWMPPIRELHFFDRIGRPKATVRKRHLLLAKKMKRVAGREEQPAEGWLDYLDRVASHKTVSREWYEETFSWPVEDDVIKGDVTPAYLEITKRKVKMAREILGDVKIMIIIRRPLDRELSQLRMWAI